jgi:hypothetical protein
LKSKTKFESGFENLKIKKNRNEQERKKKENSFLLMGRIPSPSAHSLSSFNQPNPRV